MQTLDYPYQFDGRGRTATTGDADHIRAASACVDQMARADYRHVDFVGQQSCYRER